MYGRAVSLMLVVLPVLGNADGSVSNRADVRRVSALDSPRSALGINLGEVNDHTSQIAFVDLVKQSAGWSKRSTGERSGNAEGRSSPIPEVGATLRFYAGKPGRYLALYRGEGKLRLQNGGRVVARQPGRTELELAAGPVELELERSSRDRPLRDLRVIPAAYERNAAEMTFHPRFLELLKPFAVLRFMDWLRINGSQQERWTDRARPADAFQGTEKGVALEYTIDLCNQLRTDCWLNVPHRADDDYVSRYAMLVKERLHPSLRVYVEYSNEIWNFPHGDWCQQAGEALGMAHEWETRLRYQAHRSLEIFKVFERILGRSRIVRVLAGQTSISTLQVVAYWEDAYRHADALAIAPYFCDELANDEQGLETLKMDPVTVARRCADDIERVKRRVHEVRQLATRLGLPMIGYEGGQHLATGSKLRGNQELQRLLDDANRHSDMGLAYARYLHMWRGEGGEMLLLYKFVKEPTPWGRWGLLETLWPQPGTTPKYDAVLDFLQSNAPWWGQASGVKR